MNPVRLNKALAAAGICSRRKADELITSGAVTVNGNPVTELGLRVTPGKDAVAVHGKAVDFAGEASGHTYVALHKPIQVVSTVSDPEGRTTVLDILPEPLRHKRLYPVGRLDYFSEGLLLLTDDGELTHRMTHPRYHLPKEYLVVVRENPTKGMLARMRSGMTLAEGERLAPVEVSPQAPSPSDSQEQASGAPSQPAGTSKESHTLRLVLHQGINRQIRRMCRDLGLTILSLRRISIGPVELGSLPRGACRPLHKSEIAALKKAVGLE